MSHTSAQTKISPYTARLVKTIEKAELRQTYIPAYIHVDSDFDVSQLHKLGVKTNLVLSNVLTARIPTGSIEQVAALDGVRYVDAGTAAKPMMNVVRQATGIDDVHAGTGLTGTFTGTGVVVGVIDQGFQYDHVTFYDSDLSNLRIKRVWEQDWTGGTAPEGYSYGGEITTADELAYYSGDVTSSSHGSHVAGIAAGAYSSDGSAYYGAAPDADIVLVSYGETTDNNVNLSDAVAYIFDYAEQQGKPCVVNLSLGTQMGPHDGTSSFDIVCDALQGEGRLLVGSVGNFGAYNCHVSKTFSSYSDEPLQTLVSYNDDVEDGGEIDVWGSEDMGMTVQVFIYDKYSGTKKDSVEVSASLAATGSADYTWQSNATGSVTITSEVNPLNNKPHIYISLDITRFKSKSCVGIAIKPMTAGEVHAWTDGNYIVFTDDGEAGMTCGDNDYTLAEIGGTGTNIISVGAYITRDYMWYETDTTPISIGETLGDLGSFSSHGPTVDGRLKPFITAPGGAIVSALNSNDAYISSQYVVKTVTQNSSSHYFGLMEGTSMAAPVVTGILATWLQANPSLTPDRAKEIIKATAVQNEYTGEIAGEGDDRWGHGIIDAWNGIKECVNDAAGVSNIVADNNGTAMYWAGNGLCRLLFTAATGNVSIDLVTADGRLVGSYTAEQFDAADEISIEVPQTGHGVYLLRVKGNDVNKTYKIINK